MPPFNLNAFIIENVQKNKFIYDKTDGLHKNIQKRKELWCSMSEALITEHNVFMDADSVEKRWTTLRDMFSREVRKKKMGYNSKKEWALYKDLLFLSNYIAPRKSVLLSNATKEEEVQNDQTETVSVEGSTLDTLELWTPVVDNLNTFEAKTETSIVSQLVEVSNVVSTSMSTLSKLLVNREKNPYFAVIEEGLKRVSSKQRTQCCIELLEVINKYENI